MHTRTRASLIAWTVVACTPTTPPKIAEPTPVPEPTSETTVRPEPPIESATPTSPAGPAITIAPRSQLVTASGPPSHVWFEVTNASATATIRIVGLELAADDEGAAVPVAIVGKTLDDVDYPGELVPIASGTHVLDFGIATGKLAADRPAYTFVLRAQVAEQDVAVETTVHRARRHPIRD